VARRAAPGELAELSGSLGSGLDGELVCLSNFLTAVPRQVELSRPGEGLYYEVLVVRAGLGQFGWVDDLASVDDAAGRVRGGGRAGAEARPG
jgi:hypothetical protein